MHDLLRDIRHTFRRLGRTPGFTAATLLTLALGIGANTAIFSVIHGVLLKPLPFPEPDRLIGVWQSAPGVNIPDLNASLADYITYREDSGRSPTSRSGKAERSQSPSFRIRSASKALR